MMYKKRPEYLTAKLRMCRYNVARSYGINRLTAERIKDWTKNKFIMYLNSFGNKNE